MSRLVWLSSVVALCACGAPSDSAPSIVYSPCTRVLVLPDADTSSAESQSVSAAIELWRDVGLTTLTMSTLPEEAQVPVRFAAASPVFHGVYEPSSGIVFINRELSGLERDLTVAHELGHAVGLSHVPREERVSVMNPGNLTVLPSLADQAELQRLWNCPSL